MIDEVRPAPNLHPTGPPGGVRRFGAWAVKRNLQIVLGALLVLAVALLQNFSDIHSTQFHPDESRWLNRVGYLKELLHPFSSEWEDRYLTEGQPPGGSYVLAVGLLVQGRDLNTNGPWNFNYGSESVTWWNAARGNMPTWDDILAARRTSAVLGALTALAICLIVTEMSNVVGGVVAGLFIAIHPLSVYLSTLGVSDAAFTWFTAMATLAAMALARKPTWPRAILLGVVLGGGASTKLTPLFLALGLAVIGGGLLLLPTVLRLPWLGRLAIRIPGRDAEARGPLGWKLVSLPFTTTLFFFVTYPYLWPSPYARTKALFDFRRAEMNNQARIWPDTSIDSRVEALHRTWLMLENNYSASGKVIAKLAAAFGSHPSEHGIDLPFAVLGLVVLAVIIWRRGVASPTFIGVAVAGGQALMILAGMRVDFERYYLPIVFLCGIGIGVLTGTIWTLARQVAARRLHSRARSTRSTMTYRPQTVTGQTSAD
jgi:hypothetical protein